MPVPMHGTLHSVPPASRARNLLQVVDTSRLRPSRSAALREAHASLAAAEANLLHLVESQARPRVASRPPLFRRR
jgi:hypothetical protein